MDDAEISAALEQAVPLEALRNLVLRWKAAGCTREQAEARLSAYRARHPSAPEASDDVVLEVLDFIKGFCGPHAKLFD
ncbi:MAG: hypothetical protein HOW73_49025 [Polyangiaceae bacterium]|nr:hypothetical protein [Polyangiaceae bacterium]